MMTKSEKIIDALKLYERGHPAAVLLSAEQITKIVLQVLEDLEDQSISCSGSKELIKSYKETVHEQRLPFVLEREVDVSRGDKFVIDDDTCTAILITSKIVGLKRENCKRVHAHEWCIGFNWDSWFDAIKSGRIVTMDDFIEKELDGLGMVMGKNGKLSCKVHDVDSYIGCEGCTNVKDNPL